MEDYESKELKKEYTFQKCIFLKNPEKINRFMTIMVNLLQEVSMRLEYHTIKKYISQILKSVEQDKINTKDIKVFNERVLILNSLINENIELDIRWIKQMIKEMLPEDENYKISILSTYIFDLLFHITKEKN